MYEDSSLRYERQADAARCRAETKCPEYNKKTGNQCTLPPKHTGEHQRRKTPKEIVAEQRATLLAERLGSEWKPSFWLNYGWHVAATRGQVCVEYFDRGLPADAAARDPYRYRATYNFSADPSDVICGGGTTPEYALANLGRSLSRRAELFLVWQKKIQVYLSKYVPTVADMPEVLTIEVDTLETWPLVSRTLNSKES